MEVVPGDDVRPTIWEDYRALLAKHGEDPQAVEMMERFAFYERAKKAYAIVATGETAIYANVLLEKGSGPMSRVLAFDFGASSGRAILGAYENGELSYREVHRFENNPRDKDGHFRWDFEDLLANVRLGAQKAGPVDSLAFDTWGVDFGLLDAQGRLLEDPVHYRDQRTAGLVEEAFQSLPAGALYGATGTQILNINSLYQLLALQRQEPQLWEKAHRLLFIPDLFAWALCGAQACETTIASTSQLLDPRSQSWSQQVLSAFRIPQELFAPLVKSGTVGRGVARGPRSSPPRATTPSAPWQLCPPRRRTPRSSPAAPGACWAASWRSPSSRNRAGCWASPTRLAPTGR